MLHLGECLDGWGTDPLGRRVGGPEFRVGLLQPQQLLQQPVVLGVGDQRVVELVVAAVVEIDGLAQFGDLPADGFGNVHAVGDGAMGCLSRLRMWATLLALSGWRASSHWMPCRRWASSRLVLTRSS